MLFESINQHSTRDAFNTHDPMMHAHGMGNVNFTLQDEFNLFDTVIKQLNHAFYTKLFLAGP